MVAADDFSKAMESQQNCVQARGSLLKKFDIPLHYLDFAYINECTDGNQLEKIVQILKSGEEGHYPELTTHAMKRLETIKPNSRFLRVFTPVLTKHTIDKENLHDISNDLHSWLSDINKNDSELQLVKTKSLAEVNIPKVRNVFESKSSTVIQPSKRIASTDYTSWDKYDPDTEMLKMDLDEERIKRESNNIEKITKNEENKRKIQFSDFATKTESKFEANREKEKGNEYFKAGEYNQALKYYTRAIEYCPDAIMYGNRAITYIKLNKHQEAIEDCDKALKYDPCNIKVLLRMAKSQQALHEYKKALCYAERAVEVEPNNLVAQITTEKLRKLSGENVGGNVRMEITDVTDQTEELQVTTCKSILKKEQYEVIPIPGTSRMKEPYYHNVCLSDKSTKENNTNKCTWHPFRSVNNGESSDDECLEIHLKKGDTYQKNEDVEMTASLNSHRMESNEDGVNDVDDCVMDVDTYNKVKQIDKSTYGTVIDEGISKKDKNIEEIIANWATLAEITDDANECDTNIKENATDMTRKGKLNASGEPSSCNKNVYSLRNDVYLPYSFLQKWQNAKLDTTYLAHANILKRFNMDRLYEVITNKIDGTFLSEILRCLHRHFTVVNEVEKVYSTLVNLSKVQRFDIAVMFLSENDRNIVGSLSEFLKQHGRALPDDVKTKYNIKL